MPNLTLSVPEELHQRMKRHSEVRWSEVIRRILVEKIRDMELMDSITSKSLLSDADVDVLDHLLKEALVRKYQKDNKLAIRRA